MRLRAVLIGLASCLALVTVTALALDWSFEKAAILSPIIVMVAGAVGFLIVLWTRILLDTFRDRRRGA